MLPSFHVIGITGEKRSGKNTCAKLIDALGEEQYVQIQLADPIKDGFDRLSGAGRELHKDLDEAGWTNRKAWQFAGTESRDLAGNPRVWCDVALTWIVYLTRFHPRQYTRFVIPDLRFPHEEKFFRERVSDLGGKFELWRVVSNRTVADTTHHASESFYNQLHPDRVIPNSKSRWDLAEVVRSALMFTTNLYA